MAYTISTDPANPKSGETLLVQLLDDGDAVQCRARLTSVPPLSALLEDRELAASAIDGDHAIQFSPDVGGEYEITLLHETTSYPIPSYPGAASLPTISLSGSLSTTIHVGDSMVLPVVCAGHSCGVELLIVDGYVAEASIVDDDEDDLVLQNALLSTWDGGRRDEGVPVDLVDLVDMDLDVEVLPELLDAISEMAEKYNDHTSLADLHVFEVADHLVDVETAESLVSGMQILNDVRAKMIAHALDVSYHDGYADTACNTFLGECKTRAETTVLLARLQTLYDRHLQNVVSHPSVDTTNALILDDWGLKMLLENLCDGLEAEEWHVADGFSAGDAAAADAGFERR